MGFQATPGLSWDKPGGGDPRRLIAQLGSSAGWSVLGGSVGRSEAGPLRDLTAVRRFLEDYRGRILCPCELPVIRQAWRHAQQHEPRELSALDRRLAREPRFQPLARASQAVGRAHLWRLRPLRDQRLVQRYVRAVQAGQAHGWHTIVYGLVLAIYSLPLRQGLISYARQTFRGFVHSAGDRLGSSEAELDGLLDDLCAGLPEMVSVVLGSEWHPARLDAP